ncbi:hypothetical protein TNCV_2303011 [Trichonephila clavipes]|nr:hypothetical protein TNCV_2303011 [Trichonephila clavipes]
MNKSPQSNFSLFAAKTKIQPMRCKQALADAALLAHPSPLPRCSSCGRLKPDFTKLWTLSSAMFFQKTYFI